jgi:phage tail-like protein
MTNDINTSSVGSMPAFYFSVDIGDQKGVIFQEVSGLATETQIIEYRAGDSTSFSTVKMPGIQKFGNVTLKKGVFAKTTQLWNWYSQIKMNTIVRVPVVIRLMDESGKPTMTWTLQNAWPTKIAGTDLEADADKVCVETLEIAHEGLTIANG